MEPTYGDYSSDGVEGIDQLRAALKEVDTATTAEERVDRMADILMNGHAGTSGYLAFGNSKIASNTGIFNMNSATDCPNAETKESGESDTGLCQVPWSDCYAHKAENVYPDTLKKRRLQEYLWDNTDAQTFGQALLRVKERKRTDFDYLRLSESGDFRHQTDIIKANWVAEIVSGEIQVYTYSASHKLDWSEANSDNFTVNQSNDKDNYGDRLFSAVPDRTEVPDDGVMCPYSMQQADGVPNEERRKCGECKLCINEDGPDVYVELH